MTFQTDKGGSKAYFQDNQTPPEYILTGFIFFVK